MSANARVALNVAAAVAFFAASELSEASVYGRPYMLLGHVNGSRRAKLMPPFDNLAATGVYRFSLPYQFNYRHYQQETPPSRVCTSDGREAGTSDCTGAAAILPVAPVEAADGERHAARATRNEPPASAADHNVTLYTFGLTVAELRLSSVDGSLLSCSLTELQSPDECDKLVKMAGIPVVGVCLDHMIEIISSCRELVRTIKDPTAAVSLPQVLLDHQFWNGIFPGTKWCGSGDIAKGYGDLGTDAALDKCCRAHDHCPIKLKPFRRAHGLLNFSLYTRSHCSCDEDFRRCLMQSKSKNAAVIGNMYFNVLRVSCLRETAAGSSSICNSDWAKVSEECLNEDQTSVPMEFLSTEHPFPS